jgi:SAM-dependent methyltransferase
MVSAPIRRKPLAIFTPSDLMESSASPIIDPTSPAERSRQAFLAQLVPVPLSQIALRLPARAGYRQVLDLASGAGDWAMEVARHFPRCQITGVDRCGALIEQARERAAAAFLANVSFREMDVLEPLWPFPDGHFDLVNAQFLARFLPGLTAWRPLLQECVRLLRPGGVIRLVECIEGEATSWACHTLCLAYQRALVRAGLCAALPYISTPQRMLWLDGLLSEAGCDVVEREVTHIGWTTEQGQGTEVSGYLLLTLRLLQPFLLTQGVISESEFEQASRRLGEEIARGEFAGSWRVQVSTGIVPRERPAPMPLRRVTPWKGTAKTEPPHSGEAGTPEGAAQ